jgi:hypothetical protein
VGSETGDVITHCIICMSCFITLLNATRSIVRISSENYCKFKYPKIKQIKKFETLVQDLGDLRNCTFDMWELTIWIVFGPGERVLCIQRKWVLLATKQYPNKFAYRNQIKPSDITQSTFTLCRLNSFWLEHTVYTYKKTDNTWERPTRCTLFS